MELKVNEIQLPDVIKFNYDELKAELTAKVQKYETMVYTDEQIKEAKADKASLNKLKTALNDERIRREREYMKPFMDFKSKINEIIAIIDKPVAVIDKQVKEYDAKIKQEKLDEIVAYFNDAGLPEWLRMDMIFEDNWLNKTTSMKSIIERIDAWGKRIESEMATIAQLPEFSFEASEEYKRTLDLGKAIAEGKRLADIQKRKAEIEAKVKAQAEAEAKAKAEAAGKEMAAGYGAGIEQATAEMHKADEALANSPLYADDAPKTWISFKANLTIAQATELRQFFESRKIEFEPI